MKRTLLLIISLVLIAFHVNAQKADTIPNPSYEHWDMGTEEPINWGTPNPYTALAGGIKCVFQDANDPYDGSFSARMTSVAVKEFRVPGVVTLGWLTVNFITFEAAIEGGIPWTSRPAKLKGQYKYSPEEGDACAVFVFLTEWLPEKGKRDTLGIGTFIGPEEVTEWMEFNIDINYFSDHTPDSMNIIVVSSANVFEPTLGSTMWVDAVEFEGEAGIALDVFPEVKVNVYPNPTNNYLTFEFEKKVEQSNLIIYNLEGQMVRTEKIDQQKITLEVGDLPTGTYYFHVSDGVKRISSGSFLVSE